MSLWEGDNFYEENKEKITEAAAMFGTKKEEDLHAARHETDTSPSMGSPEGSLAFNSNPLSTEWQRYPDLSKNHRMKGGYGPPVDIIDDVIAEKLITENDLFVLNGKFWIYDHGVFIQDEDGSMIKEMSTRKMFRDFITPNRQARVYNLMLTKQKIQVSLRDVNNYPHRWINFQNGMLDPVTMELHPHSPVYRAINQIPHEWHPEIDTKGSIMLSYFESWLQDENGDPREDDLKMLLQFSAYCLTIDTSFQCLLFITGDGGLGKGVFTRLLQKAIGPENCSSLPLQRLSGKESRFQTNFLFGKIANICADISSAELEDTAVMKMLTGEDSIPAEIKGGKSFMFEPYAKFIFSCNRIPTTREDKTNGWYRRLLILHITQRAEEIPGIETLLQDDVDTFIYLAVNAFHEILVDTNGKPEDHPQITRSTRSKKMVDDVHAYADSVMAFILDRTCSTVDENGNPVPGRKTPRDALYRAYESYCAEEGRIALSKYVFFQNLREKGYSETRDSQGRYFKRLELNPFDN